MSAPAAVLSQLADLAVDGATVAALVLVALVGIESFKLLRASIEDEAEMRASEANTMTESEKDEVWDRAVEQSRVEFNGEIDEDDAFESYNNSRMRPKAVDEDDAFEAYCNQRMTRN